jgi:hypothetical protein
VQVQFGPVHTCFEPANLRRTLTKADQTVLADALNTIESVYEYSPAGVMVFVRYGLGYFSRLPGGLSGASVSSLYVPRLVFDTNRMAIEEAKASPTDRNQAALNLQTQFAVDPLDNGIERFLTSTRRQNFLCPPRRHRAFPLLELT